VSVQAEHKKYTLRHEPLPDGSWRVFNSYDRFLGRVVRHVGTVHNRTSLLFQSAAPIDQFDMRRLAKLMEHISVEMANSGVLMK
jgi:hypothetical protein